METYCIETGDWPPEQILQFYKKYHACIRAKLALWHLRDVPDNAPKWTERAKTYLHLAAQD
jgi:aminoglycoside phosphotransferase family enzyme